MIPKEEQEAAAARVKVKRARAKVQNLLQAVQGQFTGPVTVEDSGMLLQRFSIVDRSSNGFRIIAGEIPTRELAEAIAAFLNLPPEAP